MLEAVGDPLTRRLLGDYAEECDQAAEILTGDVSRG